MTTITPRLATSPGSGDPATLPAEERGLPRDGTRLLVAAPGGVRHTRFTALPEALRPGDVLVVNTSATVAAELDATLSRGRPRVLHLGAQLSGNRWVVEVRTAPDAGRPVLVHLPGDVLSVGEARFTLDEPHPGRAIHPDRVGNRLWLATVDDPEALRRELNRSGRPISYGYLARRLPLTAYQSVFARHPGSSEMASAARPFTGEIVVESVVRGIRFAAVTLHTGLSSPETGEPPQAEWFDVPAASADLVNATREQGGRVVAVGTTATRAIESATERGRVVPRSGWTDLVLGRQHPSTVVTGLITGLHDPDASHLDLIEAVAGRQLTRQAYAEAVAHGYLWHEFGDSCLFLP